MGHLTQHINIDDDFDLKKETKLGPDAEDKLSEIMGNEMKSVEINFKKNPTTYEHLDLDSAFDTMTEDDYKFQFGLSLEAGDTDAKETEEGLSRIFSLLKPDTSSQPITNSVRQLDIPDMMSKFEIVAEVGDEEINQNLADTIRREKINKREYGHFSDELGEKLCELIEDEI